MIAAPVRCRFTASWVEGEPVAGAGSPVYADDGAREAIAALPSVYAHVDWISTPELAATVKAARDAGLPTVYDPAGLVFPERLPLLLDHEGEPVGYVHDVRPDGLGFSCSGYADPGHHAELAARPFVSPGFVNTAAEIIPDRCLFVTRAEVVELSATWAPLRDDTMLVVDPPAPVPEPERFALEPAGRSFWRFITDAADAHLTAILAEREAGL